MSENIYVNKGIGLQTGSATFVIGGVPIGKQDGEDVEIAEGVFLRGVKKMPKVTISGNNIELDFSNGAIVREVENNSKTMKLTTMF